MACLAVAAELSLVEIFVTGKTASRESQKTLVQVFVANQLAQRGLDEGGVVTLLALQAGMFAFQRISGFTVVELLSRGFPANELEVFSVVFRMAADAIFVRAIRADHRSVEALLRGKALLDFSMAIQAFQCASRAQLVAGGALGQAGE